MRTVTNDFKNAIKENGRQIDALIIYYDNEENSIKIGNSQINSINLHYEGNILKSVMKQLDIDLNIDLPKGTKLKFRFGVKVRDLDFFITDYRENYDYVDFGYFYVSKSEKQKDTNSYLITCYDNMINSMIDYEALNIVYPITIRSYLSAICGQLGLTFANSSDTFPNYNREIAEELYIDADGNSMGYTFRDVLDELAEVTASTICINNNDELELRYISNSNVTLDESSLKNVNVNFGEVYGPINTIVFSRSNGIDKISKSNPTNLADDDKIAIEITDNQILNGSDRGDYIDDILTQLYGLSYNVNDFESVGILYLDLCDKYSIVINNETYNCIMFNDEINIQRGLSENIFTEKPDNQVHEYKYMTETDKTVRNAEIILNKKIGEVDIKGKTINLTADDIAIDSTYFKVDKNGNIIANSLTSNNATITGGSINLVGTDASSKFSISNSNDNTWYTNYYPNRIQIYTDGQQTIQISGVSDIPNVNLFATDGSGRTTMISAISIITPRITSGNMDCGSGTCSSSGYSQVNFNKTFASIPKVVCTPNTSTNGVIAIKTRNVSTTGFEATIGGSGFSNENFDWIAIS